ncbi:conserved hypothetical protein [Sporisorium reilianum SRZ2]|uniref:Uncharacterized protein n=1 Tax=Sporisorium reilianum (strain SRZ2) TaxID=999809 RepID=E6ZLP9_SPORE|nr:conserved hypothetical protein [Sporisorium reilianum SRZ2]
MMIKLTTAFVAAAALLSTAAQATDAQVPLQCRLWTADSNIIWVEADSAPDLNFGTAQPGVGSWADITLTQEFYSDVAKADRYIAMRHNGADCRGISKAKHHICNEEYVDEKPGNSCAQMISKSHPLFSNKGKAVSISSSAPKNPVHFVARLTSSLQNWWASIDETCAYQRFDATDEPMKYLTFSASDMHTWSSVTVTLDEPDRLFGSSWECSNSNHLIASSPQGYSADDGKTWIFDSVKFNALLYGSQ